MQKSEPRWSADNRCRRRQSYLASSDTLPALLCEAFAGGAGLAPVAHAMIPEAIEDAGSAVVLRTVAGFVFGLYL
jgi:hypothetical protein